MKHLVIILNALCFMPSVALSSDVKETIDSAKEKLDDAKDLIYDHVLFTNGDKYYSGDNLYYEETEGKFEVITLIDFRKDRVKVKHGDGASSWIDLSLLMTREMVKNKRLAIKNAREESARKVRQAEEERVANCCCRVEHANFWGFSTYSKKWMSTAKCKKGWESWTELGGGTKNTGQCKHHKKNSCDEF